MKVYKKIGENEFVYKDEAQDFAMDNLGITIKPMDNDGTYTQEQVDFMVEFTEWYFSGNWYEDELEEEE